MRGEPVDFGMMFKGFDNYVPVLVVGILSSIPQFIFAGISLALNLSEVFTKILQERLGRGSESNFAPEIEGMPFLAEDLVLYFVIAGIVMLIFSIAWGVTFFFSLPILAENNVTPVEAISLSAAAGWNNVGGIILLCILQFFIALAGILLLCVGLFFALPLIYAANAYAYRQVFPFVERYFNIAPPPPSEYGFGGGNAS